MNAPHGTLAAYKSGCRGSEGCADCRAANTAYNRERRREQREIGLTPGDPRHGTQTGYIEWACRCGPCRYANHAAKQPQRGAE